VGEVVVVGRDIEERLAVPDARVVDEHADRAVLRVDRFDGRAYLLDIGDVALAVGIFALARLGDIEPDDLIAPLSQVPANGLSRQAVRARNDCNARSHVSTLLTIGS